MTNIKDFENKIICGDCITEMKKLPDNSVDAIITDPPYGLEFMGKSWDKFKDAKNIGGGTMENRNTPYQRGDKTPPAYYIWTLEQKNEFQEFCYNWAKECLRVLKPGGYLLSFGGTRTYHRMTCGIEDAGFEIRDCIMWLYGSGFPKSLNIANQLAKRDGAKRDGAGTQGNTFPIKNEYQEYTLTENAKQWEGWGTALKPAVEPIVVARKPLSEKNVALNVLKWGTGGINIDECRIGTEQILSSGDKKSLQIWKEQDGRTNKDLDLIENNPHYNQGRFPANIIFDEEAGEILDEQSGIKKGNGHWSKTKTTGFGEFGNGKSEYFGVGEKDTLVGGASRFFMNIPKENIYKYCSLCYDTLHKESNEEWKNINANNVEKNLITTQAIKEDFVQKNVMQIPREKLDQIVKSVGNLCQRCTTDFVQSLVVISENQKGVQSQEGLQVMQDFITNSKKCILFQNLVSYVEILDSIDTTQTTQNLLKLFGSVNLVITNYIQEIEKTEPLRFRYTAKASKSERNFGCEELDKEVKGMNFGGELDGSGNPINIGTNKNFHPTVKPIKLIEYLVKLVSREGSIILDPFLGSGTTAIACVKLNRNFIGIEKETDYIKIAEARIKPYLEKPIEVNKSKQQTLI